MKVVSPSDVTFRGDTAQSDGAWRLRGLICARHDCRMASNFLDSWHHPLLYSLFNKTLSLPKYAKKYSSTPIGEMYACKQSANNLTQANIEKCASWRKKWNVSFFHFYEKKTISCRIHDSEPNSYEEFVLQNLKAINKMYM